MDLKTYLAENKLSQGRFAQKIKVGILTIHRVIKEKGTVSLPLALKIEKATKGKVTCQELCKPPKEKPKIKKAKTITKEIITS
jgi:DNA-binding transcriptional regulator YdaS (Cro superfamily)